MIFCRKNVENVKVGKRSQRIAPRGVKYIGGEDSYHVTEMQIIGKDDESEGIDPNDSSEKHSTKEKKNNYVNECNIDNKNAELMKRAMLLFSKQKCSRGITSRLCFTLPAKTEKYEGEPTTMYHSRKVRCFNKAG